MMVSLQKNEMDGENDGKRNKPQGYNQSDGI